MGVGGFVYFRIVPLGNFRRDELPHQPLGEMRGLRKILKHGTLQRRKLSYEKTAGNGRFFAFDYSPIAIQLNVYVPFATDAEELNTYGWKEVLVFAMAFGTSASRNEPLELPVIMTMGTFVKAYPKSTGAYTAQPWPARELTVTLEVPYRILKFWPAAVRIEPLTSSLACGAETPIPTLHDWLMTSRCWLTALS